MAGNGSPNSVATMIAGLVAAGLACAAIAQTARIEVHAIETLDLGTARLLHGGPPDGTAPRRTIAGELRLPRTTAVRVPAVVFLHGDAGAIFDQPPWIDEANTAGFAVFTVDSFTGRGVVSDSPALQIDGALPGSLTRVVDAYRALALLANHPRIDPSRIALMGVSSGGRTTILAAMKRFSGALATTGARFAAYVALYPPCGARLVDDERLESGPLRLFIGAADNVTRADACERYVSRLRAAGVDAGLTVYPGAYHGFDNPAGTTGANFPDEPTFSGCSLVERDDRLVNVDTGLPPTLDDRCVAKGFTAGRDAAADRAVRAAVPAFLTKAMARDR